MQAAEQPKAERKGDGGREHHTLEGRHVLTHRTRSADAHTHTLNKNNTTASARHPQQNQHKTAREETPPAPRTEGGMPGMPYGIAAYCPL